MKGMFVCLHYPINSEFVLQMKIEKPHRLAALMENGMVQRQSLEMSSVCQQQTDLIRGGYSLRRCYYSSLSVAKLSDIDPDVFVIVL